jgi:hypothetical protein
MRAHFAFRIALGLLATATVTRAEELVNGRRSLVFSGQSAQLTVDLAGGSLVDFHFHDQKLNPLNWAAPKPGETGIRGFGHFLCLDRWGPPSDAEGANGMPYHGEAAHVEWKVLKDTATEGGVVAAELSAQLPMAGLAVKRSIRFAKGAAFFTVREEVANENRLGRILNAVQHPTIGPPFLDETTLVDCNGRKGFAQGGALPDPEEPSFFWPKALNQDGDAVNMRRLAGDPNPNVVTYAIDDELGWVTAATPAKGLLIGYLWKTRDYPWVSLWRDVRNGKPAARGLEFGTTGLHQPFAVLTRKGRIFDRQLFVHLDAKESTRLAYGAFLLKVPADYAGVASIKLERGRLTVSERGRDKSRDLSLDTGGLGLD